MFLSPLLLATAVASGLISFSFAQDFETELFRVSPYTLRHTNGHLLLNLQLNTDKNFMRPKTLRMRRVQIMSPAMELELTDKILSFDEVFSKRRVRTHYELDEVEDQVYTRKYNYSRQKIQEYKGL